MKNHRGHPKHKVNETFGCISVDLLRFNFFYATNIDRFNEPSKQTIKVLRSQDICLGFLEFGVSSIDRFELSSHYHE